MSSASAAPPKPTTPRGPLLGVRVLDISTVIAGPFASALMGDMGAEVLKIEIPVSGDHIRHLPPHKDGVPLWSKVTNRNKRGITLDLREPEGMQILQRLLPDYDVLVENFRPGTLAGWGLPMARMHELNPGLIVLRVTGFGQDGPYSGLPGFARSFEALSGFVNLCGNPDGPPMYPGFPVSDALTGVFGAYAVAAALVEREKSTDGRGQEIDLSATEAMFRVLDFLPIEYDQLGTVRGRQGNLNAYSAPSDVYRTADDRWVAMAVSAPTVFVRLARAWGREDLLTDPDFSTNTARLAHREAIEKIACDWFKTRTLDEASQTLRSFDVSFAPIHNIRDIFNDPHFQSRQAIISVSDEELGPVRMQNVVPRFSRTPGVVWRTGPSIGQHNQQVLGEELGLPAEALSKLQANRVI
jgi:crotonobetainyl-CoA:carnitine CoA-transferase CaiB-like acyl-CoA transferase